MSTPSRPELAGRLFATRWFKMLWIAVLAVLAVLIVRLWWVHDALLVCWRYGRAAYVHQGIRVLSGKPARFSTGELVPRGTPFTVSATVPLRARSSLVLPRASHRGAFDVPHQVVPDQIQRRRSSSTFTTCVTST